MDANGTHFHLLMGRDDWANCTAAEPRCGDAAPPTLAVSWAPPPATPDNKSGLEWDGGRYQLRLQSRLFQFKGASATPLSLSQRRGAARDRYGNWYWIGDTGQELRVNSAGSGVSSHFWSVGDGARDPQPRLGDFAPLQPPRAPTPLSLSGLAVTEDHYLVAGVLQPAGLVIFDLHAGGAPRQMTWPADIPFAPFDMAPRPGGGVWILDHAHARYWALDRHFNVIRLDQTPASITPDVFQPLDQGAVRQTATRPFPEPIELNYSSPIAAHDPISIEGLPDSTVLILDNTPGEPFSQVLHYRLGAQLGQPVSLDAVREVVDVMAHQQFQLCGHDFCFVPATGAADSELLGVLYVAAVDGLQSYAFDVFQRNQQLELQAQAEYLPMRLFGGKALVTAVGPVVPNPDCLTTPWVPQQAPGPYYDFGESWVPLVPLKRPRYVPSATLFTPVFDGREPDCVWHRLMLDAAIPPDSSMQVWSRTANEKADLCRAEWLPEPRFYLRKDGSELPYVKQAQSPVDGGGTWELLFQRARGRYLQLKLALSGNGRTTPRLRALRAYYPRFSYLDHYLPGVYREDAPSASFLDRFLANLEGMFTSIEDKIAAVQILFDTRSAPPEALDWLANWFGVVLDPVWDDARRRMFIKHAMHFFQYRGTVHGLLMALHLAFDDCVDDTLFELPAGELGALSVLQGSSCCSAGSSPQRTTRPETIRIVEKYRMRAAPAVVFGDPTEAVGPRVITQTARWQPVQGGAALSELYTQALNSETLIPFPIRDPGDARSAAWQQFARDNLGFVPAMSADDLDRWQHFLARRYSSVAELNVMYGLDAASQLSAFADAQLPPQISPQLPQPAAPELPPDGVALRDWYQFEALVLAMGRAAHAFNVLLQAPPNSGDPDEHDQRRELAKRIVDLEKPAHTVYDVKFFWALFRIGEARLGLDTLVDLGSRAPQLMPPLVIGQGYLSEGYLAPGHPQNVTERQVLGRDRLAR